VILGPSGSGKSTLLRCIAGLEAQKEGQVLFDGSDVSSLSPSQRRIAMVFQSAALFSHTRIKDNIGYGLRKLGYSKEEIRQMVCESARKLHIEDLLERYPHAVSGGERQRASIARALVRKPDILLLDEPFSSLDARLSEELQQEVIRLQKETGMTMIMVTHDQSEAVNMADQVILLHEGKTQAMGSPKELYRDPPNLFTASFLGSGRVNVIPQDSALFAKLKTVYGFDEEAVTAAVRPTGLSVQEEGELNGIAVSVHEGYEEREAMVLCEDTQLLVRTQAAVKPGDRVNLKIREGFLYLFREDGASVKRKPVV
jgi:ABC-type sugar transport system ATPase subunit